MVRLILTSFVVAFIALAALPAVANDLAPREGWIVLPTTKDFKTLVADTQAVVKGNKMGLVTQASASDGARAQGHTIAGNRVLGVYRNDFARRMLAASVAAGIEAPIRLYVTENDDQTATLSYKTPTFVFSPYFDEGGDELTALATELDGIFKTIADQAVQ